jgi:hypothetical protein
MSSSLGAVLSIGVRLPFREKKLRRRRLRGRILVAASLALLVVSLSRAHGPAGTARGQGMSLPRRTTKPKGAGANAAMEAPMPFRAGEILDYRVAWATFPNAASVELTVPERRVLFGWKTWHYRASVHTVSPIRTILTLDGQFDSYTDAATLESRQYEMYLDEMGRHENEVFHFVPMGQADPAPGPGVVVLPGTRDPLGALYELRYVDWQRTLEFRATVSDGHDVCEMRAKLDAPAESVAVAAGHFEAGRISVLVFQHDKEVRGIGFTVWIARDAAHTPVLLRADLPFGNLRVELTSMSP